MPHVWDHVHSGDAKLFGTNAQAEDLYKIPVSRVSCKPTAFLLSQVDFLSIMFLAGRSTWS